MRFGLDDDREVVAAGADNVQDPVAMRFGLDDDRESKVRGRTYADLPR